MTETSFVSSSLPPSKVSGAGVLCIYRNVGPRFPVWQPFCWRSRPPRGTKLWLSTRRRTRCAEHRERDAFSTLLEHHFHTSEIKQPHSCAKTNAQPRGGE